MGNSKRGDPETTQALGNTRKTSKSEKGNCCEASSRKGKNFKNGVEAFSIHEAGEKGRHKGLKNTPLFPLIKKRRIMLNQIYGFFIHVCIVD